MESCSDYYAQVSSPCEYSSVTTIAEHLNFTDQDDPKHIDSNTCSLILRDEMIAPAIPDALEPNINEQITDAPTPRYNRPRRIHELSPNQIGGDLDALEVGQSAVLEAATSTSKLAHESLLFDNSLQLEVCILLL